jgi:hypothetical protein
VVGSLVYFFSLLFACAHALRSAKTAKGEARILFYAGTFSFIPFSLIMLTDNIMVYASFYGNLQFTILGLAYGSKGVK